MTPRHRSWRVRWAALIGCLLLAPWLTACGGGQAPAEAVPALRSGLDAVDDAIAAGDDAEARRALESLADQTTQARADGTISDEQGDRILRAISDLTGQLPDAPATSSGPTPQPSEPTSAPTPETSDDEETEETEEGEDQQDDDGLADPDGDEDENKDEKKDEKEKEKREKKDD